MQFALIIFLTLGASAEDVNAGVCLLQNGFLGTAGLSVDSEAKDSAFPRLLLVQTSRLVSLYVFLIPSSHFFVLFLAFFYFLAKFSNQFTTSGFVKSFSRRFRKI